MSQNARTHLHELFAAALAAADPMTCLPAHLPSPPKGRALVVGAGKAAASMAAAVELHWDCDVTGLVITRDGHTAPTRSIEVAEASHPLPDQRGVDATARILNMVSALKDGDLALVLLSGGGSALMCQPALGISLEDKLDLTGQLLRSGATIAEINCVRRHLSAVKGGQLALKTHRGALIVVLAISDVPGDDPTIIAGGPCTTAGSSAGDALRVLDAYAIRAGDNVRAHLRENSSDERIKHRSLRPQNVDYRLIASPAKSLAAAAKSARELGYEALVLGDSIEGEAQLIASEHAKRAVAFTKGKSKVALLSGGELTVTHEGGTNGGPNREYALALAKHLNGAANIWAIACDTDGIDGVGDQAGAIVGPDILARARGLSANIDTALAQHQSGDFFDRLGYSVVTGPTLTNVNDFRCILIEYENHK
jgi:hydroxypyruvate reductase